MQTGKLMSITKLETIESGLDFLLVEIDDIGYNMFASYNDYVGFIDNRVAYDTRMDVYKGEKIEVITNVAVKSIVRTKEYEENPSLIPDGSESHEACNFALDSIGVGDRMTDVVVYLSSFQRGSSTKAKWVDMSVVDIKSKVYNLRVFTGRGQSERSVIETLEEWVGSYIKCDIVVDQYGYRSDIDSVRYEAQPVTELQEVTAAVDIINRAVEGDEQLKAYMDANMFIDKLKRVIDVEPGWHLVRIASEISLYNALKNITSAYSIPLLIRGAITSRGYLLGSNPDKYSKPIVNVNKIQRSALSKDTTLITMVDVASNTTFPTKRAFIAVTQFVNTIVEERRGLVDEEEVIANIHACTRMFGGLL